MNSDSVGRYISEKNDSKNELISSVSSYDNIEKDSLDKIKSDSEPQNNSKQKKIVVYICGAVKKPGVYEFKSGSRVYDAVKAADGFKKHAVKTAINQARYLEDGEQISIPTIKEFKTNSSKEEIKQDKTASSPANDKLININTASASELTSLSGIGQSRADAIIEYRETNGSFKDISDIMKISGIKEGVFNKIKNKISV